MQHLSRRTQADSIPDYKSGRGKKVDTQESKAELIRLAGGHQGHCLLLMRCLKMIYPALLTKTYRGKLGGTDRIGSTPWAGVL